jgi:hypothetical protein
VAGPGIVGRFVARPRPVPPAPSLERLSEHLGALADALRVAQRAVRRQDRQAVRLAVNDVFQAAARARARLRLFEVEWAERAAWRPGG